MTHKQEQQQFVDEWNEYYPVGTPVTRYKMIRPLREPVETKTRSAAWVMGGHTAMVQVEGAAGGVCLESLAIREADVKEQEDSIPL